jgi:hypothetical protein
LRSISQIAASELDTTRTTVYYIIGQELREGATLPPLHFPAAECYLNLYRNYVFRMYPVCNLALRDGIRIPLADAGNSGVIHSSADVAQLVEQLIRNQ